MLNNIYICACVIFVDIIIFVEHNNDIFETAKMFFPYLIKPNKIKYFPLRYM